MSDWMIRAMGGMQRAAAEEEGQTMAEYGLILAGIAVVVMATVFLLGGAINTTFTDILNQF